MESIVHSRVLAYNVAKEITEKELAEVSGGFGWCMEKSQQPSGKTGSWDMYMDVHTD